VKRKRIITVGGLGLVLAAAFLLYWFYFSTPEAFPVKEELVNQINLVFPDASPKTIQDTVFLDDQHVFVPFITKSNEYGVSYWAWERHKWQAINIDTVGEPRLWRVDKNDPASYYFVWNIHPSDSISKMKFYFVRDRAFHVQGGVSSYTPKIQMEKEEITQGKSYGIMKLPNEWITTMTSIQKAESASQPDLFSSIFPRGNMYFAFTPFHESGEEASMMNSVNGNGYQNGDITVDFIIYMNQLEVPKEE